MGIKSLRKEFTKTYKIYDEALPVICSNCYGKDDLVIHHIVPLAVGGTNNLTNLSRLCSKCHSRIHGQKATIRELQREGIELAKQRGAYDNNGAETKYSPTGSQKEKYFAIVDDLKADRPIAQIARDRGVSRPTIYKIKDELEEQGVLA